MKQILIGVCCLILCSMLMACGNRFPGISSSYYSDFTAKGEGNEYEISGKSQVVNTLPLVYISTMEDTRVDLFGELKSISGDIQIIYINPDNKETILSDSGKDSKKGNLQLNTTVNLEKGDSRLEFRGKESTFKFDLLFDNIDKDKIKYFSAVAKDNEFDEEIFEESDMEYPNSENKNVPNEGNDKFLNEVSVTYTNQDNNCIILDTSLNKDTKIKVLVDAGVTNADDKDSLSFDGFHLAYKTEDNNTIKVLKYKTNEFAMGGYEWQDSFVQELVLPKGTSELIFNNYDGKNYEIHLNIQVIEVD